ncbi:MAG: hypothetical protein ACI8S6_001347 [Myxococcota bacterium]|jgi:hypothetical protein
MSERMSVAAIEELPVAYERLIRAIQTGVSVEDAADRDSVTASEQSQARVQADPMAYVQLGGRTRGVEDPGNGAIIGGGYRHSLDRVAVDAAVGYLLPQDLLEDGNVGMFLELSGLYYLDGEAKSSLYFGGGGGLWLTSNAETEEVALDGLSVLLSGGYELMRHSSIQFFPQIDVILPTSVGPDGWSPALIVTANAGFTPGALRR